MKALIRFGHQVGVGIEVTEHTVVLYDNSRSRMAEFCVEDIAIITPGVYEAAGGANAMPARLSIAGQPHELLIMPTPGLSDFLFLVVSGKRRRASPVKSDAAKDRSFYGAPDVRSAALAVRLSAEAPAELTGPFRTLRDAEAALEQGGDGSLFLFSRETGVGSSGAREFWIASPHELVKHLRQLEPDQRCWYEVIRDSNACKLYLDVEYSKQLNSTLNGGEMMQELLRLLIQFVSLNFPDLPQADCSFFVDLESIYPHKFSRHVIFPRVIMQDNIQIGIFLHRFREYVELRSDSIPGAKMCFVRTEKSEITFVCDLGVYGKSRNFRLAYCTKSGKNSPLLPLSAETPRMDDAVFCEALLCWMPPNSRVLVVEADQSQEKKRQDARRFVANSCVGSPYPKVDQFVRSLVETEGGFIRSAIFFPGTARLTYSIGGGFKYCGNVMRHHKSNGVYFVVEVASQKVSVCLDFFFFFFFFDCFRCSCFKSVTIRIAAVLCQRELRCQKSTLRSKNGATLTG